MDNSPLGRLPAELRNHIWELALYQRDGNFIELTSMKFTRLFRSTRHPLGLLRACRATYIECRAMFYAINTFHLECRGEKTTYSTTSTPSANSSGSR